MTWGILKMFPNGECVQVMHSECCGAQLKFLIGDLQETVSHCLCLMDSKGNVRLI